MANPVLPACLASRQIVMVILKKLKAGNCRIFIDREAGTAVAYDGQVVVYRALSKGLKQPWIVLCYDGPNVKWRK